MISENRLIIYLFILVLFLSPGKFFAFGSDYFSYLDELFCFSIFFYVLIFKKYKKNNLLLIIVLIFWGSGIISSWMKNVPLALTLKGSVSLLKAPLLFYSLSNIEFKKTDLYLFFKTMNVFSFTFLFFWFIDFIFKSHFRDLVGYEYEIRLGLYVVNSFYELPSIVASVAFFQFLISKLQKKRKKAFSFLLISILSLRVKQIVALFITLTISKYKKRKLILFLLIPLVSITLFGFYKYYYSEHYDRYFQNEEGNVTARTALVLTSYQIAKDNFPLGEGFGRFGSSNSVTPYSPVYMSYGIDSIYGLTEDDPKYVNDTFWPSILGETGVIGLLLYILILYNIFGPYIKLYFSKDNQNDLNNIVSEYFIFSLISSITLGVFIRSPEFLLIFFTTGIFHNQILSLQNSHEYTKLRS